MVKYLIYLLVILTLNILKSNCYKYISSYEWKNIRKQLANPTLSKSDKQVINQNIFNKYKERALEKAKEFKSSNKLATKNIRLSYFKNYALVGLTHAVENFNPNDKINFARYSDKIINENLFLGLICPTESDDEIKQKNLVENNYLSEYWDCINNNLNQFTREIIYLKFSHGFDVLRSNEEIAKIMNCSTSTVSNQLIESTNFIFNKVKSNYITSANLFSSKTLL